MADVKRFGVEIRAARKRNGLSMRELAVRLRLSAPYISDIEHGRRAPFPEGRVYAQLALTLGGSERDWAALGAAERIQFIVDGLPEHVSEFVRDLVVNARHISPTAVGKMRELYTVPAS